MQKTLTYSYTWFSKLFASHSNVLKNPKDPQTSAGASLQVMNKTSQSLIQEFLNTYKDLCALEAEAEEEEEEEDKPEVGTC
jgi:hypothetical protein